ncbi:MAG: hypothetical protein DRJ51_02395 [Thermoprotei archaeon]|nr:MAG: hypothetical protein DRJ36_03935 [Thermoprotei archaeon]RLE82079.1 MAG: hypothetical protein DRJ51_02395 [Thermoprotei archaeon]RLF03174.1 MAG: hypothetical protein DRJ59_01430 [Thermoprotei archaeon]
MEHAPSKKRSRYLVRALKTPYWRPGCNYIGLIIRSLRKVNLKDDDIVIVSEKAIAVAEGNIVDESKIRPGLLARFLARIWMRIIWGYFLGVMCRMSRRTLYNLRNYPLELGARHKQLVIRTVSPLQALSFGSEGGIDATNLPYAYVSLPLKNPVEKAEKIRKAIEKSLGKRVIVMVLDSDRCYSWKSFHICPRSTFVKEIASKGGFMTYVLCNFLRLKASPTPLAIVGGKLDIGEALRIACIAEKYRGHGAGRDVWEMARRFGTELDKVTWKMLESIPHRPIVVIRKITVR